MKTFIRASVALSLLLSSSPAFAMYTLRGMKIVDADLDAYTTVEAHFEEGVCSLNARDLREAKRQFLIVTTQFPNSPEATESLYYLAATEYCMCKWETANEYLNEYLKCQSTPLHFRESMEIKFGIAERYRCGEKRRIFGKRSLPKWLGGEMEAKELYDEVAASLPADDLAAKALFSKGCLLQDMGEYSESVDAFQTVIRRFPKNELAIESYLAIIEVYREQCEKEFQNPDLLALAQITLKKFSQDFPKEERVGYATKQVRQIQEIYARGLYTTAILYEKKGLPTAAIVYYKAAIDQFPNTGIAGACWSRLLSLAPEVCEEMSACE